jgi:hypothetical protein
LGIIVFYVSNVLAVPYGQITVGLAYVCFVAGFALQFVDAAFVVVGCRFTESDPGLLLYRVCASEGYFDVYLKRVSNSCCSSEADLFVEMQKRH